MKKREYLIARNKAMATRNGLTHTPTGSSWGAMVTRCYNKNHKDYKTYGAVGIYICDGLRHTPLALIESIGERPEGTSIDRIDGRGSYTCGKCDHCLSIGAKLNVRWATPEQQTRNQITNRLITIDGETKCVADWADIVGCKESLIRNRADAGITGRDLLKPAKSRVHIMTIDGVSRSMSEWADSIGISLAAFYSRINRGWSGHKLLSPKLAQYDNRKHA